MKWEKGERGRGVRRMRRVEEPERDERKIVVEIGERSEMEGDERA